MYRLEKLNEKGETINQKEFKTIRECATAFNLPYHTVQRLYYHSCGELKYKKAISKRTDDLLKNYRLKKTDDEINVNFD